MKTVLMRCKKCGAVYPIIPGVPRTAPHSPDKTCTADEWEVVDND